MIKRIAELADIITLSALLYLCISAAVKLNMQESTFYLIAYGVWCCSMTLVEIKNHLSKITGKQVSDATR